MDEQPTVLDRYAAANQACRNIAQEIGVEYEEHPRWRAAERVAEQLWQQAREAGHTAKQIIAAGQAEGGHT